MKIAFIVNQFPALSETFILNQITGLLDRGHEVDIYAHSPRNDPGVHADVEEYDLLKRTYYMTGITSMPRNKLYRFVKGIGRIAIDLPKKPVAVLNSLNLLKFSKSAASLQLLFQIAPFLNKGPYDIVQCHFGPSGILAITLKAVGAIHGQIVTTFHGTDISSYIQKKGEHIYDDLFKTGDLFLCVSDRIKETLIKLGCDERKIIVHRCGVSTSKIVDHLHRSKTGDKIRLITIARLVEKKGVKYGIQSVARVLKKYPNIEYKIAGDGHLRNSLQVLIEDLKVSENVKLLGWQMQEQITRLLQEADILLAPSVTSEDSDSEGIPVAIMEALAGGIPVLGSFHSGIPEAVQNGVSGLLVPEGDVDALSEKLEYLIQHSELRAEMGRKGRKYVEEHYDIDKQNDRLVEIYRGLLEGKLPNA
jgi:colanic acid/amylovoran biosynthesis glycosyltransferase